MLRVICALIARLAADLDDYGERVDPWEKRYEQYLRVSEDEVWVIQLFHGELHVETADGRPVDPAPDVAERTNFPSRTAAGACTTRLLRTIWT